MRKRINPCNKIRSLSVPSTTVGSRVERGTEGVDRDGSFAPLALVVVGELDVEDIVADS